jgi:hypothetical protein
MRRVAFWIAVVSFALVLTGTGALVIRKLNAGPEEVAAAREQRPVPVEVAAIEVGAIEQRRVFSGDAGGDGAADGRAEGPRSGGEPAS